MLKSFKLKLSARHTACTTCQKGYYQPDKGQTSCIMCDKGYFQENIGQTICDPCPEEYYQPGDRGFEKEIKARMEYWRRLRDA